jgi:hypothetical protein
MGKSEKTGPQCEPVEVGSRDERESDRRYSVEICFSIWSVMARTAFSASES